MTTLALFSSVLLLAVLAGAPQSTDGGLMPGRRHHEKYVLYWLYKKAFDSVLGEDFMRKNELVTRSEMMKCFAKAYAPNTPTTTQDTETTTTPTTTSVSDEEKRSLDTDEKSTLEDGHSKNENVEAADARAPFFNADWVVRPLKNQVLKNVQIIQCYFDYLNLTIDSNGTVDGSAYIQQLINEPLYPEDIKNLLVTGAEDCETQSDSGNVLKWGAKYADFLKLLNFFRCNQEKLFEACIAVDLTRNADDFDLSGLDGELSDVGERVRRRFIYSSYANWDHTGLWDI